MKNIVLCSDGTGNRGGKGNGTNVFRLYNTIDLRSHERGLPAQMAFYDDGVGTEDFKPLRLLGGALGWGLSRNIRELYAFLVKNYVPGDRIYLFGFSRGAFTVRSLAGMIGLCGVLNHTGDDTQLKKDVERAFRAYRRAHRKNKREIATTFAKENNTHEVHIECIGVWDTVDAVGVPIDELRWLVDLVMPIRFHEHDLAPYVRHGYHALAIDDERTTFHPVMWDESENENREKDSIEQVWFAGAHSNVGGGYPKQGMAYISLYWMMRRAERHGLCFEDGAFEKVLNAMNVHDKLYDSRTGLGAYYRYGPRDIGRIAREHAKLGERPVKIHASVFHRIAGGVLGYAPGNLPTNFEVVTADGRDPYRPLDPQSPPLRELLAPVMSEYEQHKKAARPWILARKLQGVAFALFSAAIALGVIQLNVLRAAAADPQASYLKLLGSACWQLVSSPVEGLLGALFGYFAAHPLRFAAIAAALLGLYGLRRWFLNGTTLRFVRFWSRSRRQMAAWLGPRPQDGGGNPPVSMVVGPPDESRSASKDKAG